MPSRPRATSATATPAGRRSARTTRAPRRSRSSRPPPPANVQAFALHPPADFTQYSVDVQLQTLDPHGEVFARLLKAPDERCALQRKVFHAVALDHRLLELLRGENAARVLPDLVHDGG